MSDGRLLHVNASAGGVPKLPLESARITTRGVEGDRQAEATVHGGPHRAVSILGIDAIRRVAAEGHPIGPGTTGENLTVDGFDVSLLAVGTRLGIGEEVVLELSGPANPCRTIRHSFSDRRFGRLGAATHPADSRMYARVIREGLIRPGDPIRLSPPESDAARRFELAQRLDRADRASTVAFWKAAAKAGHEIHILDDGELAVSAAPSLPGPAFNIALGLAHLPDLVDRAAAHFSRHGTTGWIWAEEPPWPDAAVDATGVHAAAAAEAVAAGDGRDDVVVRELGRDEVGAWAEIVVAASELPEHVSTAFRDAEPLMAESAHHHRFVASVDGVPAGAASLHTHHGVGWLRAGSVLHAHRGRGVQRALIRARAAHARKLGCDLVGASANEGGTSARNLARAGFEVVAVRQRYRVEADIERA